MPPIPIPIVAGPGGGTLLPSGPPTTGGGGGGGGPGIDVESILGGGGGGPGIDVESILGGGGGAGATGSTATGGMSANTAILAILGKPRGKKWRSFMPAINELADELDIDRVFLLAAIVARNPNVTELVKFAQRYAKALAEYGTVDAAFRAVVGGGATTSTYGIPGMGAHTGGGGGGGGGGPVPSSLIPGRYVSGQLPGGSSSGGSRKPPARKLTPEEQVAMSIYKSELRKAYTDPWVTVKNGKITFSQTIDAPKGSLGRRSDFMKEWANANELWEAYLGRKAKAGEVALIMKKGWSNYTIADRLSKRPAFRNSVIWKAAAPALEGIGLELLGDAWKLIPLGERQEMMRKAIIQDWSSSTFAERLRKRPEYLKGVEFRTNTASLQSVYESIYGLANATAMTTVQEAALARWSPDQFAAWLRSRPGYTGSQEYLGKALSVLEALTGITGVLPTLVPGQMPASPQPAAAGAYGAVPDSQRVAGAPGEPAGLGLTLGGGVV
jgi:hypothetical protein